jgi:serine phosphatase RsbU (regulator of sigma subunit)
MSKIYYFSNVGRIRIIVLIFITVLSFSIKSISQETDSTLAYEYFDLFIVNEYSDSAQARMYADSGLYFAQQSGSNYVLGKAHQFIGWNFQDLSLYEKSRESFFTSLAYMKKTGNKQAIGDAYGNLGNAFLDLKDYQKSLDYQLLSLDVSEEILSTFPTGDKLENAKLGKTYSLHNIGAIYQEIEMHNKGLEYALKSLQFEEESNNLLGIAISCASIGNVYNKLGKIDSTIYYFKRALSIYESGDIGDSFGITSVLFSYSLLDSSDLTMDERKAMFFKSLELKKNIGDVHGEVQMLLEIVKGNFGTVTNDSLAKIFTKIDYLIESHQLEDIKVFYFKYLASYKAKIGDFESAYNTLEDYLNRKEDATEKVKSHSLIAGDIMHRMETKNLNDSLKIERQFALERVAQSEKMTRVQNIVYFIVIGIIILTISLFFILRANKNNKKLNIELIQKNALIQENSKQILDSITYAKRLQRAILPSIEDVNEHIPNSFLIFLPKDIVSGDFHWFEAIDNTKYVAVADCTGHGVPGAMVSVVCSNALSRSVNEFGLRLPSDILNKTRELVIYTLGKSGEEVTDGMDISLIALSEKTVQFSGANNSLWIIRQNEHIKEGEIYINKEAKEASLLEIKGDNQPVGLYSLMKDFTTKEIDLEPNDVLYMSSDGFPDQFGGEKNKKFKQNNLKIELLSIYNKPMTEQKVHLENVFTRWKGSFEQTDDVCLIGIYP